MDAEIKKQMLIKINNLCDALSSSIEKHFETPDCQEIIQSAEQLEKELRKYLT